MNVSVMVPPDVEPGNYHFVGAVDSSHVVSEPDEDNNITVTTTTIDVAEPTVDLVPPLTNVVLPSSLVAGDPTPINVPVEIRNDGNVGAFGSVDVDIMAAATGTVDSTDTLLYTVLAHPLNHYPGESGGPTGGSSNMRTFAGLHMP